MFVVVIVYTAYYISTHYVQLALIQGDSMLPSYHNMQIVLVDRQYKALERDDVVLFKCDGLNSILIKRIVAVPGDMLTAVNGKMQVNSTMTDIPWDTAENISIRLADDEFFVVGDNYGASVDSRSDEVGIVDVGNIIGKVF